MVKESIEDLENQNSVFDLRVAAGSPAPKVAGALTKCLEKYDRVSLSAIGAGAVNQAVKAICIARGYVSVKGKDLYFIPGLVDDYSDDAQKTSIKFFVYVR